MGSVIGDLLLTALGVAISPVPIVAVILMLLAPRAKAASVGFVLGWVLGVVAVITVVALLVDPADDSDGAGPSTWTSVVLMLLGAAACFLAVPGSPDLGTGRRRSCRSGCRPSSR